MTLQIFSAKTSESDPPKTGEVLGEDEHLAAEDRAIARDDGVTVGPVLAHAELGLAVPDEAVELDERAGIEEPLEPLPGEELAALTLALDRRLTAGVQRLVTELLQPPQLRFSRVVCRHQWRSLTAVPWPLFFGTTRPVGTSQRGPPTSSPRLERNEELRTRGKRLCAEWMPTVPLLAR